MCIEYGCGVYRASKDIQCFKVFRKGAFDGPIYLIYRKMNGYIATIQDKAPFIPGGKARGFDAGYGFHCFRTEKEATDYKHAVIYYSSYVTVVKEVIIPKGTRYEIGRIKQGIISAGALAIRAEVLEFKE